MPSAFQVLCWMLYWPMEAKSLGFAALQPFGAYPWYMAGICASWQWSSAHTRNQWVAAPSTALSRGNIMLLSQLSYNSVIPVFTLSRFKTTESSDLHLQRNSVGKQFHTSQSVIFSKKYLSFPLVFSQFRWKKELVSFENVAKKQF